MSAAEPQPRETWREMRDSMVSVLAGQETHDALVSTIRALIAELDAAVDAAVDARELVVPSPPEDIYKTGPLNMTPERQAILDAAKDRARAEG